MTDNEATVVRLDSVHEIRALHRMLFNRKFDGPEDVYFGSPLIASVQNKLADALAGESAAEAAKWAAWRDARRHPHILERIRQHLAGVASDWWANAPAVKRQDYVRDLLAPLTADESLLAELTTSS
jgi:hypothetical protein